VFAVLPFAPITIPVIVKLGKSVGVDILPSAFAELSNKKENQPTTHADDINSDKKTNG
jgi:hypothetical protein